MKVDHCFILAAGHGRRMGEIGKILPKPLWPIFELTLLELQVLFAKSLGIESIYVNLFFEKEKILKFKEENTLLKDVHFICEDELLGSGGGVHHLAQCVHYKGVALIINVDQFLSWDLSFFKNLPFKKDSDVFLFTREVSETEIYNRLLLEDGILKEIIPFSEKELPQTMFTGNSLINLPSLLKSNGVSSFFETVAPFRKKKISSKDVSKYEYIDFGTKADYEKSIRGVLKGEYPLFLKFLKSVSGIKESSANNFYDGKIFVNKDLIDLEGIKREGLRGIFFRNIGD